MKEFSYSLYANIFNVIASILIGLLIPALMGVTQFGYWQLYLFYAGYVLYSHFGWIDGIYLRHGGKSYETLNKPLLHSQFFSFSLFEVFLFGLLSLVAVLYMGENNKTLVLVAAGLNCILWLPRTYLQYLFQGSGRVKEYATNLIIERLLNVSLILFFLLSGRRSFKAIILADLIPKVITLILLAWQCRDLLGCRGVSFSDNWKETRKNLKAGSKVMFATVSSMLIIGIIQFSIERNWNIEVFGMVAFSLVTVQSAVQFINQLSVVLFPILKRSDAGKLPEVFQTLGAIIILPVLIILLLFYPLQLGLSLFLPDYTQGIAYLGLLFPVCLFESRTSLLLSTFMKTLRKETEMMRINLIVVALSLFSAIATVWFLKNIDLAIFSIVILLGLRCTLAELYVQRQLKLRDFSDLLLMVVSSAVFILASWVVQGPVGWLLFAVFSLLVLFLRWKQCKRCWRFLQFQT
jgi:O-antigen/teichoic acid export membrane protein